ncbi:TPA: hypothetical protein ACJ5DT_002602 [Legionella pneumophila]|uniref:Uncharacterized protein n=2 Tax=Legionella TaxID=445 RepID=A0A2S6EW17_LEGPN|nr:hypothetical protein [Legionella pneumophila]OCH97915.1 hypothetical protein A8135_01450 [Legionella jamestowniensis]APF04255.1 hypothetical protein BIZ52_13210 [Legionella pneumophila subsp. fraseri]APF07238.1 hypothetical protein BIZ51_13095 [Legionella pneumophila subsp. fraseri]AUB69695.1 hypothetical protein BJK09_13010 [Legionella pneumophila]AUB72670.1 hypothetical protein BJK08_13005 [Legionella pneumophila]
MNIVTVLRNTILLIALFLFFSVSACTSLTPTTKKTQNNGKNQSSGLKHKNPSIGRVWASHTRRH